MPDTAHPPTAKSVLTYSALNTFRNCPRKYKHRYADCLRPREKAEALSFGGVIHGAIEMWYRQTGDDNRLWAVLDYVDGQFPQREHDQTQKAAWQLARAMVTGYAACYPSEDFEVVEVEKTFTGEIRNPDTGRPSQTFVIAGKADAVVRRGDGLYLLEHKTASGIDAGYLDKLWTDTQIALYSHYLRGQGYPIVGVIYNVLLKARLQQKQGETQEEYEARRLQLAAKNKSGRSTAKRQMPETDEAFQGRLADWYARPEAFHREHVYLSEDRLAMLQEEVWEITQQYLDARRPRQVAPQHVQLLLVPAALRVPAVLPVGIQPECGGQPVRDHAAARGACPVRFRRPLVLKEHPMPVTLPTQRSQPTTELGQQTVLLYSAPKLGKSTFASRFPDAVFLECEPGLNHLDVFKVPTYTWDDFLAACKLIAEGNHSFKTIVVDTVDNAFKFCSEHVCARHNIEYEGDMGHGKGWALVKNEWHRVLTRLASLPYGLVLISHAQDKTIETRTGEYTKTQPSLPDRARNVVLGLVDIILYGDAVPRKDADGNVHYRPRDAHEAAPDLRGGRPHRATARGVAARLRRLPSGVFLC